MSLKRILPLSTFALSALVVQSSFAESNSHKYLEDQIAALEAQLNMLKVELNNQKEEMAEHKAKMAKEASTYLKPGWKVKSKDKKHEFSIGGRMMWDVHNLSPDAAVSNAIGVTGKDGVEFRRTRLFFKGKMHNKLSYQLQYDFTQGGVASLKATYLKYKSDNGHSFWVGNVKEPFGLETLTSSKYDSFIEESGPTEAFSPSYNPGFMYMNEKKEDKVGWALGVFRTDAGGFGMSPNAVGPNNGGWNFTGRLGWTAAYDEGGKEVLHFGLGVSRRNSNTGNIRFRSRVENHFWNARLVDTGNIAADDADLIGYEAAWVSGPFSLQTEFYDADVDVAAAGATNANFDGYYVQAGYFLTGEHRPYNRAYRFFGRVKPKTNFFDGERGAWEVTARYSNTDLNDPVAGIAGRETDSLTLGVNWHLDARTRVMLNWVNTEVTNGAGVEVGDTDALAMRFQTDF